MILVPKNVASSVSKRLEKLHSGQKDKELHSERSVFFLITVEGEGGRGNSGFPVEEGRRSRWKTMGFQRAGGVLIGQNDFLYLVV